LDLTDQVSNLESEITVLKTQIDESAHVKSAYNSDKEAFSQHAQGLKEANDTLREEHSKIQAKLHLVQKENETLSNDVDFYKQRL